MSQEPRLSNHTYEWRTRAEMVIDLSYQRPLNENKVNRILNKGYDSAALGVPVVNIRADGTVALVEGQHRIEAGLREGVPDKWYCEVHHGLSPKEEAGLFLRLNDHDSGTALGKFVARITAGEEVPLRIEAILATHGWEIRRGSEKGTVSAVNAIERVYRTAAHSLPEGAYEEITEAAIAVVTKAWGHDTAAATGTLLEGLAQVFARNGDGLGGVPGLVDTAKLVRELTRTTTEDVLSQGRKMQKIRGGSFNASVAYVLVHMHNKGKKTLLLPEWTWIR